MNEDPWLRALASAGDPTLHGNGAPTRPALISQLMCKGKNAGYEGPLQHVLDVFLPHANDRERT